MPQLDELLTQELDFREISFRKDRPPVLIYWKKQIPLQTPKTATTLDPSLLTRWNETLELED